MFVYVYVCVSTSEAINNYLHDLDFVWLVDWLIDSCCFLVPIYGPCHQYKRWVRLMCCLVLSRWSMALAVYVMHGHGPINEMCTQLQPNKTKVWLY